MQTTSMTKTTIGTTMVGTVLDVLFSFPAKIQEVVFLIIFGRYETMIFLEYDILKNSEAKADTSCI